MNNSNEFDISFDLPKNQSNVIKVIGVGGGGSNAINHMFKQGIKGVDFVVCNTDSQALENSPVPTKLQLGVNLTEGLGAGANPEIGEQAALESFEDLKTMLNTNTKMVFITAGMGGGTGTGAAPIIAKQAKEMDILTVGIVTIPFQFEGRMRNEQAQLGVEKLRANVDSLIVINNNKLREVYGNLGFKAGFSKADEVLATASRGIAEVITHHYTQNIDLRDAKTVLSDSGTAIMGSATATGSNRAQEAITKALDSPLLNDNKIRGAQNVLLLIVSGRQEITIDEIGEINDLIQTEAGNSANIIMGVGEDDSLEEAISVTVIATGFNSEQQDEITNTETKKIIHTLEDEQKAVHDLTKKTQQPLETPSIDKPLSEEKVVHTLLDEEEEAVANEIPFKEDLTKAVTTPSQPVAEIPQQEVQQPIMDEIDDDFIIVDRTSPIHDIEVNNPEEVLPEEPEQQGMFVFDFPINTTENTSETSGNETLENTAKTDVKAVPTQSAVKKTYTLTDEGDNGTTPTASLTTQPETNTKGETRYNLDDYLDLEENLDKATPQQVHIPEPKLATTSTINIPKNEVKVEEQEEEINPLETPISSDIAMRAAERRAKMKNFNYKFRTNTKNLEDIEKQPAYKRAGINIDNKNSIQEQERISRTTLSVDKNNEMNFRTNNSFLHDNVD
ncbi:cell division protein FtsZ [Mesonia hippocampi]|uniref:Cell division protein FtsZ n=1 Tax=Mesonia hippocampi TaxID=1628250 RepID=A0A840ENU2_9FLAO|nr:cell division protein FtsZ [Mesonia hippocampi]MBB4118640.1 cell division protein FtsZ [Mesonia hippocampi]